MISVVLAKILSHHIKNEKVMTKTLSQLNAPVLMMEPPEMKMNFNLSSNLCNEQFYNRQM